MSDPRFVPRSLCVRPTDFGVLVNPEWLPVETRVVNGHWANPWAADQTRTAQLQNQLVYEIRGELARRGMTTEEYATELGISWSRMGRMLRGRIIMRLEDVASAERLLGIALVVQSSIQNAEV